LRFQSRKNLSAFLRELECIFFAHFRVFISRGIALPLLWVASPFFVFRISRISSCLDEIHIERIPSHHVSFLRIILLTTRFNISIIQPF